MSNLLTFYLLVIGHLIADFVLQRELAIKKKGFNRQMFYHGATAAFFFFMPLINYPLDRVMIASLMLFVVHTFIDTGKIMFGEKWKIKPNTNIFWAAIGIDQVLHITSIYVLYKFIVL